MKSASDPTDTQKSLLILGQPGVGKTTLVTAFPGLFILDTDTNVSGPIEYRRKNKQSLDFFYADPYHDDAGVRIERKDWFARAMKLLAEAAANPAIKTIAIDSLTSFIELVIIEVLVRQGLKLGDLQFDKVNAKTFDDQLRIQDYGAFARLMTAIIMELKATRKTIICTGHLQTKEDEISKMLRQYVSIPGKTAETIASFFSDVVLIEASTDLVSKQQKRTLTTFPGPASQSTLGLKSSCGVVSGTQVDPEAFVKAVLP